MFFLSEEAFSQMHVILARQGRKKVQLLMEELIDDWFRREERPPPQSLIETSHGQVLAGDMA